MVAKFISKLSQTQFYGTIILLLIFGGMATGLLLDTYGYKQFIPSYLPISLLIIPYIFVRKKTNPEEFDHLPKNRLTILIIGFIVVSLGSIIARNLN